MFQLYSILLTLMKTFNKNILLLLLILLVAGCQRPDPSKGAVSLHQLESKTLGRQVAYQLYSPAQQAKSIIYLLHGHGGDHQDWFQAGEGNVAHILDSLIANRIIPPVYAVSAQMGNSWYVNRPAPAQDFYLDEFMPYMETDLLKIEPTDRLLAGNSAGGYGGLRFSLIQPDRFDGIILLSPASYTPLPPQISSSRKVEAFALDGVFNDSIWNSFSYLHLLDKLPPNSQMPMYFISTGDDDAYNIVPAVTNIQQQFLERNIANELRITNGGHDWECWQENFARAMTLYYNP